MVFSVYELRDNTGWEKYLKEFYPGEEIDIVVNMYRRAYRMSPEGRLNKGSAPLRLLFEVLIPIAIENKHLKRELLNSERIVPEYDIHDYTVVKANQGHYGTKDYTGFMEGMVRFELDSNTGIREGMKLRNARTDYLIEVVELDGNFVLGTFTDIISGDVLRGMTVKEQASNGPFWYDTSAGGGD